MSATGGADERPIEVRLRREIAAECRCGWGTALVAELAALREQLAEAEEECKRLAFDNEVLLRARALVKGELEETQEALADLEGFDPYPVEVWSELTTAEEQDIYDAIRGTSVRHPLDRLFASWGRRVLANRRATMAEEGRA